MPKISEAERQWCLEYGEKIGAMPKFMPNWHEEAACVEYVLVGYRQDHSLELCKFVNSDAPDGWTAYLFRYGQCYLQGDPYISTGRPQTPEEAINEIVEVLAREAEKTKNLASMLRGKD